MSKLFEQLRQLERLDQLIRLKATGSPKDLAQRMDVSERTIYNLMDNLRTFGAEVGYCRNRESYYYENDIKFRFDVVLHEEKVRKVKGGKSFLNFFNRVQKICSEGWYFYNNNVVNRN